jgi:alanine racemase
VLENLKRLKKEYEQNLLILAVGKENAWEAGLQHCIEELAEFGE